MNAPAPPNAVLNLAHGGSAGAPDAGRAREPVPISSWYALGVLAVVLVYAVTDRQIFVLLNEQVRTDLGLSDGQMGVLQGLGLALFSAVTVYPISWLADRMDRRIVAAACVVVWSLAVLLCGLAPSFPWLLAGASAVGVGEAGIQPTTLALLPDLFPPSRLQLANSIHAISMRLGGAAGALLAGYLVTVAIDVRPWLPGQLASLPDWRLAFLVAAMFMPVAVALLLSMPRRASGLASRQGARAAIRAMPLGAFLHRHAVPQFGIFLGFSAGVLGYTCMGTWLPVIAARDFGQTPLQGGQWLAAIGLLTGIAGFAAGTPLVRFLQRRFGTRMPMVVMTLVLFASTALSGAIGFARDIPTLYGLWAAQSTLLMVVAMVLPTMLQTMSPPHLRARLFAINALIQLVGGALGPLAAGILSDALGQTPHALLTAATIVSMSALALSGTIFQVLGGAYSRMVEEVTREQRAEPQPEPAPGTPEWIGGRE